MVCAYSVLTSTRSPGIALLLPSFLSEDGGLGLKGGSAQMHTAAGTASAVWTQRLPVTCALPVISSRTWDPGRVTRLVLGILFSCAMATPDVSVHMEEVVVVTTPDTAVDGSGVEEVKTVLVTTNLAPHG